MRENYQMFEENAKILEVAEVLSDERPLFLNELIAAERVFLSALIQEGIDDELFEDCDSEFAAEMLQAATVKFSLPQLFSHLTLPKLERELDGVFSLLMRGLYARPGQAQSAGARAAKEAAH